MAPIASQTVYTKTAKGILEIRNKSIKLPKELNAVFLAVDGRATVEELLPRSGMTAAQLQHALSSLLNDGYIKMVAPAAGQQGPTAAPDAVAFGASQQELSRLNAEVASHALAEGEASKLAQQEERAALDARLREEAEARARALAENRAQAEAEARAKAEAAAVAAADAQAQAEAAANAAHDAASRAEAASRARNAAAAAVRAHAEARARAEAEERARAAVAEKKTAEQHAREEAQAHAQREEQAHARALAEARARTALEAQLEAIRAVEAHAGNPDSAEAEAARAELHRREAAAERAREEARTLAQAQGVALEEEPPLQELHFDDLAQKLKLKVQAERRAREEIERRARAAAVEAEAAAAKPADADANPFPALELVTVPPVHDDAPQAPAAPPPQEEAPHAPELPSLSFSSTAGPAEVAHSTPEHVPSALERAMLERARTQPVPDEDRPAAPPRPRVVPPQPEPTIRATPPAPQTAPPAAETGAPEPRLVPMLDEDEPVHERVNVDRAAHDILAEAAEARHNAQVSEAARSAAAARRQRMEEDRRRDSDAMRRERRGRMLRNVGIALVAIPVLGAAYLQFVPLNGYVPAAQQALSQRLNQPVTVSTLRYVLLPTPRVILENVNVGVAPGIRINRLEALVLPWELLGGPTTFGTVEATGITIDSAMLAAIPSWTGGRSADAAHVDELKITELKLDVPDVKLQPLSGKIDFAPNGTVTEAVLSNESLTARLKPEGNGTHLILSGRDVQLPFGPPLIYTHLNIDGIATGQRFSTTELSGRVGGGTFSGTLAARWEGPTIIGGEIRLQGARLEELLPQLAPGFAARGMLNANMRYALQSDRATGKLGQPLIEGAFAITKGELRNIDLIRAIQSPGSNTFRGGRTGFDELRGTVQTREGAYNYRQLQLTSGPINGTGYLDVGPTGQLNGRLNAVIAPHGNVTVRAALVIAGTVRDPVISR